MTRNYHLNTTRTYTNFTYKTWLLSSAQYIVVSNFFFSFFVSFSWAVNEHRTICKVIAMAAIG